MRKYNGRKKLISLTIKRWRYCNFQLRAGMKPSLPICMWFLIFCNLQRIYGIMLDFECRSQNWREKAAKPLKLYLPQRRLSQVDGFRAWLDLLSLAYLNERIKSLVYLSQHNLTLYKSLYCQSP